MYYSAIDIKMECICTRFYQKDFKVYQSLQELLLKAVAGEDHGEELAKVTAVYGPAAVQARNPAIPSSRQGAVNWVQHFRIRRHC